MRTLDWNRRGHWYLRFTDGTETVDFAFPAGVPTSTAIALAQQALSSEWRFLGDTWRASFDQHCNPSDAQPSFGKEFHPDEIEQMRAAA